MGTDNDGLNTLIGDSRHWYSNTRIITGIMLVIFIYGIFNSLRGLNEVLIPCITSLFLPWKTGASDSHHTVINGVAVVMHRIENLVGWLTMQFIDFVGYQSVLVMIICIPVFTVTIWFVVTRFSQDASRASIIANNDH